MASNQTSNFGLNQWEPGDRVRREEFNADNQKIDAALAANKLVNLLEFVPAQPTNQIDITLPDKDWGQYTQLRLIIDAICPHRIYLRLNGVDSQTYYHTTVDGKMQGKNSYLLGISPGGAGVSGEGFLMPFGLGAQICASFHTISFASTEFTRQTTTGLAPVAFSQLRQLNFRSDGSISVGSRFALYGLLR